MAGARSCPVPIRSAAPSLTYSAGLVGQTFYKGKPEPDLQPWSHFRTPGPDLGRLLHPSARLISAPLKQFNFLRS